METIGNFGDPLGRGMYDDEMHDFFFLLTGVMVLVVWSEPPREAIGIICDPVSLGMFFFLSWQFFAWAYREPS